VPSQEHETRPVWRNPRHGADRIEEDPHRPTGTTGGCPQQHLSDSATSCNVIGDVEPTSTADATILDALPVVLRSTPESHRRYLNNPLQEGNHVTTLADTASSMAITPVRSI
jgi:hypothetical protein